MPLTTPNLFIQIYFFFSFPFLIHENIQLHYWSCIFLFVNHHCIGYPIKKRICALKITENGKLLTSEQMQEVIGAI